MVMLDTLLKFLSTGLDAVYMNIISPSFIALQRGLEILVLWPLKVLYIPPLLQVVLIATIVAMVSITIRRYLDVDEKEQAFRKSFTAKKKQQENLQLISDWKSRERFAKAIDDDIDQDFNTYLAGRFSRYGIVYLLPIFLTLGWLDSTFSHSLLIPFKENSRGLVGITTQLVFLLSYCTVMFIFFRLRKKRTGKAG
jgi:uncharacterized membrane protein (DUF106 family)